MEKKGTILMDRYEMGRLLGQGNFAKVYYGKDIKSGKSVAIKVIDKEKTVKAGLSEQLKREISVMKVVKHQNVLQLYEIMATKSKIFIVLEYAKGGELFNKVVKGRLKVEIARWIFQQLITAVDCCHKRGVYHRDLKLENLLIDEDGTLKVADFGLSALAESKRQDGMLHTMCGTPAYVAPEVINRRGYDGAKADIWSCGVILYVILAGYLPFKGTNLVDMYKKITRADYSCPNWFPPEARKLLVRILDPNPKTRIPISKIMESSWFKKGLGTQPAKLKADTKENVAVEVQTFEKKLETPKRTNLNAFDIISMSSGLDLSGLFVGDDKREDIRFTSLQPASAIVSKLEQVASNLNLEVAKKEGGSMKLAGSGGPRKEGVGINVEIFEFAPSFHLVEMKKANGDTLDYQKVLKQDIQPALNDIVWAWQGDNQVQPQKQEINGVWNPLQTEINVF